MSEQFYAMEEGEKCYVYERDGSTIDNDMAIVHSRIDAVRIASALNACRNVPAEQLAGLDVAKVIAAALQWREAHEDGGCLAQMDARDAMIAATDGLVKEGKSDE